VTYIENPKSKGSGIICCIPQKGACPNNCDECFFNGGRSYLEPLDKNTPNMPSVEEVGDRIVRVNDGNDSTNDIDMVLEKTEKYPRKFYNTCHATWTDGFISPFVLTANPGGMTDLSFHTLTTIPKTLMFVRFRTNTWNLDLADKAVKYYTEQGVPVVLTFMAYRQAQAIRDGHANNYELRKRTLNVYWAICHYKWRKIMFSYRANPLVYSCGTEGLFGSSLCKHCGNCLREYFATMERMKDD